MSKHSWILVAALGLALLAGSAIAHPIPDLPVRSYFTKGGAAILRVEVDPRCFANDAENEPYLQKWVLDESNAAEKKELIDQAKKLVAESVTFHFEPLGRVMPEFKWTFTSHDAKKLVKDDDPVMMTAEWKTTIPEGVKGYRIKALEDKEFAVPFINHLDGKAIERVAVLFPGEESFLLDVSGHGKQAAGRPDEESGAANKDGASAKSNVAKPVESAVGPNATAGDRWATLWDFLKQGFVHVLPKGLDHILFVLGLFFLSREWRPLIYQVSMFTLAHTVTLFLSTLGMVSAPGSVVEPLIAASIAFVAIENIYRPKYTHWRLLVVFVFGLVHGLGFAGALAELELPAASLVVGLLGFNIGVEFGQLAVVAIAFTGTAWLKEAKHYRRYVVVPGSAMIALLGAWWTVERIVTA